jgi:transposase-like protein
MATKTSSTRTNSPPRPTDTEVRRARRSWPATYKLEILTEIDAAERSEIGAIMRREGLYSSLISEWRKQRDRGALEALAERRPGPAGKDPVKAELARLRDENAGLREHVATCEELIGAQGKAFALLQSISTASSATPSSTRPHR